MTRFEGFGPRVRQWFVGLEADNSREYFSAHRAFFDESVRGQMAALLTELSDTFGGEVKLFRPNRDIRFSADKSPYKTNTYGLLLGSGVALHGLYASVSADGLVAGSGYHVMARDQLERYRERAADDRLGPELAKLLAQAERKGLEVWGERRRHRASRLRHRPPADRAAAPQEPDARRPAGIRRRHRAGRRPAAS